MCFKIINHFDSYYIRNFTKRKLDYTFISSKIFILSRLNRDRYLFSHIYEMRISISSSIREMTYDYYLKLPKSMCEIKVNRILAKTPKLINYLNSFSTHPLTRKYTH